MLLVVTRVGNFWMLPIPPNSALNLPASSAVVNSGVPMTSSCTFSPALASVPCTTWLIATEDGSPPLTRIFQFSISALERPEAAISARPLSRLKA